MPDFTKPGDDGGVVHGEVKGTGGGMHVLPDPLKCGLWYVLSSTVEQSVEKCEGYDYTKLYERARYLNPTNIKCPSNACSYWDWAFLGARWGCANSRVYCTVVRAVRCNTVGQATPPDPQPKPEELSHPHKGLEDLPPSGFPPGDTAPDTVYVWERWPAGASVVNRNRLPCPSAANTMRFCYQENVWRCPANYAPFVERAEEAAKAYAETVYCSTGCHSKIEIVRRQWLCFHNPGRHDRPQALEGETVEVNVYFTVECAPNP